MNSRALPILMLMGIVAVWGWTFVIVKEAIVSYGVIPFLAVRFAIAALVLLPFAWSRWNRESLRIGGCIGVVLAVSYLFQTFGLKFSTPTNTGLITGLFIVFAPLTNLWFFKVPALPRMWVAVGLSVFGLVLLTGQGANGVLAGDGLTLGAAFCLGLHVALLDRYAREHDAVTLAFAQMASVAICFLLIDLVTWRPITRPTGSVWFALLLTGVVASAAGFFVQTFVQQRLTAVQTSVIIMLEPPFAVLFGLFAGDRLTLWQWVGGAIMMGAVLIAEFAPARSVPKVKLDDDPPTDSLADVGSDAAQPAE